MASDYFCLGGLVLRIESESGVTGEAVFRCASADSDLTIFVKEDSSLEFSGGGRRYSEVEIKENTIYITVNPAQIGSLTEFNIFNAIDLPGIMLEHDRFVLHSSYIIYNGEAILFTGNSGIGKSTQAEFWRKERGAEIVNGDRCLISRNGDSFYANGYINCGSSGICKNVSAPVKAVVALDQAAENSARRLSGIEAFKAILPQCAYDVESAQQTERVIGLVADFIPKIKVVNLNCVNSPSAVEYLEKYL